MNLTTIILYAVWAVLSILTFIAPFACDMTGFWKVVLMIAGGFNALVNATRVPEIIKWFKDRKD